MTRHRARILALATLALPLLAIQATAQPRPQQRPVTTDRTDRSGVRWEYSERTDLLDDTRQIFLVATHNRTSIGLLCMEGLGVKFGMAAPRWYFPQGVNQTVMARIDQAEAFEVTFFGESPDGRRGTARPNEASRNLVRAISTARERLILRNPSGETAIFPMTAPRPEAERFRARCQEITPTLDSE